MANVGTESAGPSEDSDAYSGSAECNEIALGGATKRCADTLLAFAGLLALLPLFSLVCIAIKATTPGPMFYGHKRIGHRGKTFKCWKFRTMVADGDAVLRAHFDQCPDARKEWETSRKLSNDPRVTALGHVLRKYSVDELPQLLNVLQGDMSFVGPRPVVEDELEMYGPFAADYLAARPGITGLWQTSGRSDTSYEFRVALDNRYVREWSFFADIKILLKTIPVVVGARGSY
ncbi:MAG: sugar transferase [Paracoccaceae bacterium]